MFDAALKNGDKLLCLEVVEVVLVQCNLVENQQQQKLYTFIPNKSHAYLLNVEANSLEFLKIYYTEFDETFTTFTDQNVRPLEIEDKVNLTLPINKYICENFL